MTPNLPQQPSGFGSFLTADQSILVSKILEELGDDKRRLFDSLTPHEKQFVLTSFVDVIRGDPNKYAKLWEIDFVRKPVTIDQFIEDKDYFGSVTMDPETLKSGLYPCWHKELDLLFNKENQITEVVITGSIGTGKTTLAVIAIAYKIYWLTCLRNPFSYFDKLQGMTSFVFCLFNATRELGANVHSTKILSAFNSCPYFRWITSGTVKELEHEKDVLKFPNNIKFAFGSRGIHGLGQDFIGGLLDEMNFQQETRVSEQEMKSQAREMYRQTSRRINNRFPPSPGLGRKSPGLLFLVSSRKGEEDFLDAHIRERGIDESIHVISLSTWEAVGHLPGRYPSGKWFSVVVGDDRYRSKILEENEPDPEGYHVIKVPEEHRKEFMLDTDGCLVGDTKISLLDGTEVPIKDLVGRDQFWTYSYSPDGRLYPGRGHSARLTQEKAPIYEVTLDDMSEIRVTGNHLFMLRDGTYKRVDQLERGDSLMPCYRELDRHGYEMIMSNVGGSWRYTHRIIASENEGIKLVPHLVVHHKNFDKRNNEPTNLEIMLDLDHRDLHKSFCKPWTPEMKIAKSAKGVEWWKKNHDSHSPVVSKSIIAYNKSDKHKAKNTETHKGKPKPAHVVEVLRQNGINGREALIERNKDRAWSTESRNKVSVAKKGKKIDPSKVRRGYKLSDEARALMSARRRGRKLKPQTEEQRKRNSEAQKIAQANRKRDSFGRLISTNPDKVIDRGEPVRNSKGRYTGESSKNNHEVHFIEFIGYEDVYDITVDTYNNFALTAGVVVHNSLMDIAGVSIKGGGRPLIQRDKLYECIEYDKEYHPREHPFKVDQVILGLRNKNFIEEDFQWEKIVQCVDPYRNIYSPIVNPMAHRYIHLDPATSGDCSYGFAMSHVAGRTKIKRYDPLTHVEVELTAPVIYVDIVLGIRHPPGDEIDLAKVRSFIFYLRKMGFPIYAVNADMYQSVDTLQIMKKHGYESKRISMDLKPDNYGMFRQAIHEGRLLIYEYKPFVEEAIWLQIDRTKKDRVYHLENKSKDVSDAVAGTIAAIMLDQKAEQSAITPIAPNTQVELRHRHSIDSDGDWMLEDLPGIETITGIRNS